MSRLDSGGGFGGARVVKPQSNVYTVLLLIACLFMGAALAVQVYRYTRLKAQDVEKGPAVSMTIRHERLAERLS